jgi:Gnt-I system high-affinity gluconate transporter
LKKPSHRVIFLIIVVGIALQIILTKRKVSPFLSLLLVAILIGLAINLFVQNGWIEKSIRRVDVIASVKEGVGSTLGGLALILCLGSILGRVLELSGATEQITTKLIKSFGEKYVQWAVLVTGFLVGIPLYYNAGFVILVPIVFSIARKTKLPLLYVAIPMAAALSTTHCFLPPHPGPVFLVNAFKANLGETLVYGIVLAIPIVVLAGPLLGRMMKKIATLDSQDESPNGAASLSHTPNTKMHPSVLMSFLGALLPVVLITLAVLAENFLEKENELRKFMLFIGDSTMALLIGVLFAIYFLGLRMGKKMPEVMRWLNEAVAGVAIIMMIITAGGVLKQVLVDSGTATYITTFSSQWQINPLVFGWLITALLRVAIGSATVAGITAAGIVSPIVAAGLVKPELMVIAVGAGSVFCSHINDSGFWMFKEFFKLTLKQTFLSWTLMESIISVLGLAGVLLLQAII